MKLNQSQLTSVLGKKAGQTIFALTILILVLSAVTLPLSPLPWYDEIDFVSITRSFYQTGKLICTANNLYFATPGQEVLYYGPLYFAINAGVIKVLGFGIVQCRILNFAAGIACIPLFLKIDKDFYLARTTRTEQLLFILLLESDYTFVQDMHSGRMDLVSLALLLLSVVFIHGGRARHFLNFIISGLLIGAACLVTPRLYFMPVPFFLLVLLGQKVDRGIAWRNATFALLTSFAMYACWIWLAFGSLRAFEIYLSAPTSMFNSAYKDFFIPAFPITIYQLPSLLLVIGMILLAILKFGTKIIVPFDMLLIGVCLFYFLLAGGSSIYFCLISGYLYLLLLHFARVHTVGKAVILIITVFNCFLITYKFSAVLVNRQFSDQKNLTIWINKHVARGSRIVAEDQYYYACIQSNNEFQYYTRGGSVEERIEYQANTWPANYLLVADTAQPLFRTYRQKANLSLIGIYRPENNSNYSHNAQQVGGFLYRFVR